MRLCRDSGRPFEPSKASDSGVIIHCPVVRVDRGPQRRVSSAIYREGASIRPRSVIYPPSIPLACRKARILLTNGPLSSWRAKRLVKQCSPRMTDDPRELFTRRPVRLSFSSLFERADSLHRTRRRESRKTGYDRPTLNGKSFRLFVR